MKFKHIIISLGVFISLLPAQFGQNIVQYDGFKWRYIQSEHFDIYYYGEGFAHAKFVALEAERAYDKIATRMMGDLGNRVSIIIYNSHNDFQQTNVIDTYLYEGIGGVTELYKNRIVIPFDGSHKEFKHVIHHELVHAFINDNIYGGNLQSLLNSQIKFVIPGWMNEGLAEYLAEGWNTNSDMWIRDLAINGGDLPPIQYLNGYMAYRGGQSVWKFITEKWGEEAISEIFVQITRQNSVEKGIEQSLGIDIEELSDQWHGYLKKQYWPDVEGRDNLKDIARKLTDHKKLENTYNIAPAMSPDGRQIAIISNKDGPMAIYLIATEDGRFIRKIIQGERNAEFEELHILKPGTTWSPDGKRIAFAAKSGESDALFVVDVFTGKRKKYRLGMEGIFRPAWNPRREEIAFIGNNGEVSDIYIFDLETEELTNLTDDWFTDEMVSWAPDGENLLFVSDRGGHLETRSPQDIEDHYVDQLDIYLINRTSGKIRRITDSDYNESYPVMSSDGKTMAYISDESGINNIYLINDTLSTPVPITNVLTGITQISWSWDDTQIIFSGFEESGYDIFILSNPKHLIDDNIRVEPAKWVSKRFQERQELLKRDDHVGGRLKPVTSYENYVFSSYDFNPAEPPPQVELTEEEIMDTTGEYISYEYKTRFTLDLIQPYYDYNTTYNPQAMAFFLWSDILGDHRIYLGTEMNNISLKNSDYFFMYRYLPYRTDLNVLFSHVATIDTRYFNGNEVGDYIFFGYFPVRLRKMSMELMASRPFSRFKRLEYGLEYAYAEQSILYTDQENTSTEYVEVKELVSNTITTTIPSLGYVWDNTIWTYTYPIEGERYYLRYEVSPKWSSNALVFQTISLDARKYYSITNGISFAGRLYAGFSFGKNAEKFRVGGLPWLFSSERTYYANLDSLSQDYYANDLKEIFFTKYVMPVRGAQVNERFGNKAVVMNLELRLPFLIYYFPTVRYLGQINGVIFTDFGMAWSGNEPDMWTGESWNSAPKDFVWTYGFGPRFIFLGMPWQLDYAWEYNPTGKSKRMWYLSIGFDF